MCLSFDTAPVKSSYFSCLNFELFPLKQNLFQEQRNYTINTCS